MGEVSRMSDHAIAVKYNGKLIISTGRNRFETKWKNGTTMWSKLLNKLSESQKTAETHAEYMKMPKSKQDESKTSAASWAGI